MDEKKKEKVGKVQSKRSKIEDAKHTVALVYYIIMLIFALLLFTTLTIVWIKIWPLLEKLDEITNSTTSNIAIFFNLIMIVIKV